MVRGKGDKGGDKRDRTEGGQADGAGAGSGNQPKDSGDKGGTADGAGGQ